MHSPFGLTAPLSPLHSGSQGADLNLITGFVNGSDYQYDTLTTSGVSVSAAVSDGSGFAGMASNAIAVTDGVPLLVTTTITMGSATLPDVYIYPEIYLVISQSGAAGAISNLERVVEGPNSITLTPNSTQIAYLQLRVKTGEKTDWASSNIVMRPA